MEHHEGRQVVVHASETVGHPRPGAGASGELAPGLDVGDGRVVVDGLGVDGLDDGEVIDHFRRMRQQLADPGSVRAMAVELEDRGRHGESLLPRCHGRDPLAVADGVRQVLVVVLLHLGLVVPHV